MADRRVLPVEALRQLVNDACECGGLGPDDAEACPACCVWHRHHLMLTPPDPRHAALLAAARAVVAWGQGHRDHADALESIVIPRLAAAVAACEEEP